MLRKPGDRLPATGVAYTLPAADDLLVRAGITFRSLDNFAITGGSAGARITINGTVIAASDTVHLTGDDVRVTIGAAGILRAGDDALSVVGDDVTLVLNGKIGGVFGVRAYTDSDAEQGITRVLNAGSIFTQYQSVFSLERLFLTNSGLIASTQSEAVAGSPLDDRVVNAGVIVGDIQLGDGNDLYDGRGGTVIGTIFGGVANDRFVAGRGRETLDGGDGVDTIDFRDSRGVRASLDGMFAGTGRATGDTFAGIETILGSLTGADSLRGDGGNNLIRGYGGDDALEGAAGNDTLTGGAGSDTITTGSGINRIVYGRASDGGDLLMDFANPNDDIYVSRSGFGLNLPLGALDPSRFHSGLSRQAADAGDRFIFETDANRLWFDRDGTKGKFAPVLIATVEDAAVDILATDIYLF